MTLTDDLEHSQLLEELLLLADSFQNLPTDDMYSIILDDIKCSGRGVSNTFFGTNPQNAVWGSTDYTDERDKLAVAAMSYHLSQIEVHGFNKTVDGSKAWSLIEEELQSSTGQRMGIDLLLETLVQKFNFEKFLSNKSILCSLLESKLSDKSYIIGTIVESIVRETDLPNKMKILFLHFLGSTKTSSILKIWNENTVKINITRAYIEFIENDNHIEFVAILLKGEDVLNSAVFKACAQSKSSTVIPPVIPPGPAISYTKICYGQSVRNWVFSGSGPKAFGVCTFKEPNNVSIHYNNPFGCFIRGTFVLLNDGSQKEIERMSEAEKVVGMESVIGTVSSEKVKIISQDELVVFGFNGEDPFFTASHPFMTDRGWMALNPNEARKENDWLHVGQLKEGQFVKKFEEYDKLSGRIKYRWIKIENIQYKYYPAGTPIFGLHLREGPRSYHANGYLVFLNYPEITTERIRRGVSNLSAIELEKFAATMKTFGPYMEKLLGPGAASVLSGDLENFSFLQKDADAQSFYSASKEINDTLPLSHVLALNMHVQLNTDKELPMFVKPPSRISFIKGRLYLEGIYINNTKILDVDTIFWEREVNEGETECGILKFDRQRLICTGTISVVHSPNATTTFPFIAKITANTYNCFVFEDQRQKQKGQIGSSRSEFGKLIMGYDEDLNLVGEIQILPYMEKPDTLDDSVVFYSGKENYLHVKVDIPNEFREYFGYVELSATFDYDFSGFHGEAIPYDPNKDDTRGTPKVWIGDLNDDGTTMFLLGKSVDDCFEQQGSLCIAEEQQASTKAMFQEVSTPLNIRDLFMLDAPDDNLVHKTATDMLIQTVKYNLDDDTRSNVLGITKPILDPPELKEIAENSSEFLGQNFGNSYLLQALSQCESMKKHFSEDDRNKLLYYWNGNEGGCLSTNKDYSKVNTDISRVAFLKLVPKLQLYIDDDGEKWAKALYEKLTSKKVMTGLIVQAITEQGRAIINKQTMVLLCLCPDKDYYLKFHQQIIESKLQTLVQYFKPTKKGANDVKAFIQDAIRQLIIMIENDSDKLSADIKTEIMDQIHDAQEELHIDSIEALQTRFESFATEIFNMMVEMQGTVWKNFTEAVGKWMKKFPTLSKVGKCFGSLLSIGMFSASVFFTVSSFMNWKNLTTDQKISTITNTLFITMKVISKVSEFFIKVFEACRTQELTFTLLRNLVSMTYDDVVRAGMGEMIAGNAAEGQSAAEAVAEAITDESAVTRAARFRTFLNVSDAVLEGLNIVALTVCAVVIGFQIARDFKSGAPVYKKVLDIIQGVCIGIQLACSIIGAVVESTVVAAIGTVCAVIGIVMAIVVFILGFTEKPKPKPTPAEKFLTGKGKKFLESLPKPPQKWLDEYNKTKKKTEENLLARFESISRMTLI